MDAGTKCKVRKVLVEVLEAHKPLKSVPSKLILADGKTVSVRYENGHVVKYENGEEFLLIHHHNGSITLVGTNGHDHVEGISRECGLLQGIDVLPQWALEALQEIASTPSRLTS